jgi:nicotinamide-nucleotide amidase
LVKASIIAIGSELLTPLRVDTNSLVITEQLNAIGFDVRTKIVVGDDVDELSEVLAGELGRVDLIVCTGGLGPTEDDVTREAVARVLERPLVVDAAIVDRIRRRFDRHGLTMPAINTRQAMVPTGAAVLNNENGTAPGLWMEHGSTRIVLLPGPPREMTPMFAAVVRERLSGLTAGSGLFRRILKITGRTESDVDSRAQPVYTPWRNQPVPISTTILAALGQIELHLTAAAPDRATADAALDAAVAELMPVLGATVYSTDGRPLEAVVGDLLKHAGWTIAAAESCTGGLLTSRLTDVPGSSAYVTGSVVCYDNKMKVDWAGVPEALIAVNGAVSEPVGQAMAEGIRARAATEVGIGVTGIAGPDGGTPEKPVGTVVVAVATGRETRVRTFRFIGNREQVKYQSTQAALNMLRLMMTS